MSNTKRSRIQTDQSRQLTRMTQLACNLNDKQFDFWLMKVVQARAATGSERAKEMLEAVQVDA